MAKISYQEQLEKKLVQQKNKHLKSYINKYYQWSPVDIEDIFNDAWDRVYSRIDRTKSWKEICKFISLDLRYKWGFKYRDFAESFENTHIKKQYLGDFTTLEKFSGTVDDSEEELLNYFLSFLNTEEKRILTEYIYHAPIEITMKEIKPIRNKLLKLTNGLSI